MEYKFTKINDQDQIIMIACEDRNTYYFPCSQAEIYIGNHLINPNNIPENTSMTSVNHKKFQVKESEDFYLLKIFEIDSESNLLCKNLYLEMNNEIVNIKSLIIPENFINVKEKTLPYLTGEIILVNKRDSKYILMTCKTNFSIKKKTLNSIPKKIGTGIIFEISQEYIWAIIEDGSKISVSLPAFITINQIKIHETLINRRVSVYEIKNIIYFKLKKEKVHPSQIFNIEEFSNTFFMDYNLELQNNYKITKFVDDRIDLHPNLRNQDLFENEAEKHKNHSYNENSIELIKNIEHGSFSEVISNSSSLKKSKSSKDHYTQKLTKMSNSKTNIKSTPNLLSRPKKELQINFSNQDLFNPNLLVNEPDFFYPNLSLQEFTNNFIFRRGQEVNPNISYQEFSNNFDFEKNSEVQKNFSNQDLCKPNLLINEPNFFYINFSLQEFTNNFIFGRSQEVNPNITYQEFSNNFVFENELEAHKNFIIQEFSNNNIFEASGVGKKNTDFQEFRIEFISENEPKIDYSTHTPIYKFKCLDLLNVFEKPKFNYNDFALSEPIMNKNLGSVIGLGIIEHLIRFKKDFHFKNLIENVFTKCSVFNLYVDILNIPNIKNVSEFNKNNQEFSVHIKRIGEGVLSLIEHDIETFEGIQELCNTIGCCIHFRNFTEGFTEIKIVPTVYQIKRRPIINIGKYFNDYFLLYTMDMVAADGFYDASVKPIMNFPFYDEDLKNERKLLKSVIKRTIFRITEIKDYLIKKLSGTRAESVNYEFEDVVKFYESYSYEKYNCRGATRLKSFIQNLSFQDVIYQAHGKKYFCNCGCIKYFYEATHEKKTCCCRRDYSLQHLNNKNYQEACACKRMTVRDLLTSSYNIVI